MSALDFFRKLAFAADPLGAEVNQEWKTLPSPRLACRLHLASIDGRRDEEILLMVTDEGVKVGSATKRTRFQWREVELRSAGLARRVLLHCHDSGMARRETYPPGAGELANAVLAVRTRDARQVFRFHQENGKDLKPLLLLWEMEDPESPLRLALAEEFLTPVDWRLRKTKTVWKPDPGICACCDRRLSPEALWRGVGTEDGGVLCADCARLRTLLLVERQGDGVDGFREVAVRQVQGQPHRKLLESKEFSFIVFLGGDGGVTGFHLTRQGGDRVLMWKRGAEAEAFESRNVGASVRFDVFVDSTFETTPTLANLEACGGNIRTEVMAALREGLLSYGKVAAAV